MFNTLGQIPGIASLGMPTKFVCYVYDNAREFIGDRARCGYSGRRAYLR